MSDRNRKVGQLVINQPKLIPGIHWLFKINDLCQSIKIFIGFEGHILIVQKYVSRKMAKKRK